MRNSKVFVFALVICMVVFINAIAARARLVSNSLKLSEQQRSKKQSEEEKNDQEYLPTLNLSKTKSEAQAQDPLREARGNRFNSKNQHNRPIEELPADAEVLPRYILQPKRLPAIPAFQSDAIIVGETRDAQAYLSTDRTNVYSEFTFRVDQILKDSKPASLQIGQEIAAQRFGGALRFPSGKIHRYSIDGLGMPRVGHRYVIFLQYNEESQAFSILTGYKLLAGRVIPLDNHSSYKIFNGSDEHTFLNAVRNTVAHPEQHSPEEGR